MLGDSQTDALGGGRSEQTWAHVTVGEGEHFYLLAYAQQLEASLNMREKRLVKNSMMNI